MCEIWIAMDDEGYYAVGDSEVDASGRYREDVSGDDSFALTCLKVLIPKPTAVVKVENPADRSIVYNPWGNSE